MNHPELPKLAPTDRFESAAEREQAEINRLYAVHRDQGKLGTFYDMFPRLAAPGRSDGRER
jgi:hypothetical protein